MRLDLRLAASRLEHAAAQSIETTFDMGFDRSDRYLQGRRRLRVRKAGAVTEADAKPLGGAQGAERLIEIEPFGRQRLAGGDHTSVSASSAAAWARARSRAAPRQRLR